MVLLHPALNSIPLFYFSSFRALMLVIKKISQIQCAFLWKGKEKKWEINWDSVCHA